MNKQEKTELIKGLMKGESIDRLAGRVIHPVVEVETTEAGEVYHVQQIGKTVKYSEADFRKSVLPYMQAVIILSARDVDR